MVGNTAKEVLTGSNAKVFLDGEELGTWSNLEVTVTINYEDVQIGFDVDRKAVSWQGEVTLNWQATNSMTVELFNKLKANKDVRFVIEAEITSDATGETQSETINGVTFDSLPLSTWAKGELVTNELSGRFIPSASQFTQLIA
jgi:hypothetical protein